VGWQWVSRTTIAGLRLEVPENQWDKAYLDTVIFTRGYQDWLAGHPLYCADGAVMGTPNEMQEATARVQVPES
jgi:hypothetical protein